MNNMRKIVGQPFKYLFPIIPIFIHFVFNFIKIQYYKNGMHSKDTCNSLN